MKKVQILKANHQSKNDKPIAVDMDISLLSADKNSKAIKINHKKTENETKPFINK